MAELDVKSKIEILKDTALKNIEKKYGKEKYYLGERKIPKVPLICSSGSLSLDQALCIGGFPEGRLIEIGGQESSGKSTLTLLNIAEIQRNGKVCAYLDVEQSFDPSYAARLGVDVYNLAVFQPETMEETFEMLFELLSSSVVSYIVVDSTNAMIPRKMLEGDTDTSLMGKSALLMSQQLPKVVSLAASNKCTVVFLSQIRSKIGVVYGSPEKIGVGEAMKFMASVRIKTSKTEVQKDEGEEGQSSVDIVMMVIKNKVGAPFKKAQFTLLTGANGEYGIDTMKEVIEFAIKYDMVKKAGSWFTYTPINGAEEKLGQGMPNVKKFFTEYPDKFKEVKDSILSKLAEDREKSIAIVDSFSNIMTGASEEKVTKRRGKKDDIQTVGFTPEIPEEIKAVMDEEEIKEAEIDK